MTDSELQKLESHLKNVEACIRILREEYVKCPSHWLGHIVNDLHYESLVLEMDIAEQKKLLYK